MRDQDSLVQKLCEFRETRPTKEQLQESLDKTAESVKDGITKPNLKSMVKLVTSPNKLPQSASIRIIRDFLYPQTLVPTKVVIYIVSSLGKEDIGMQVKNRLLRWLVVVYDYLEEKACIERLYGLIFAHLRYEMIRQWICHLLFLSTKKEHVRPWRVKYLLEMFHSNKESQHLAAILSLYRRLAPELVLEAIPPVRPTLFAHPDPTAMQRLKRILGDQQDHYELRLKRSRTNIPEVHTMANGTETVRTLRDFTEKVHKLDFPLQMGSVLNDSGMLVKLLQYRPDPDSWERLNVWLEHSLDDRLLERVFLFTDQCRVFPGAAQNYVLDNLTIWDGSSSSGQLYLKSFQYLNECDASLILDPLDRLVSEKKLASEQTVLDCIRSLARLPWRSSSVDEFVAKHGIRLLGSDLDVRIATENTLLEYFELTGAHMPESLVAKLSKSTLPCTLERLSKFNPQVMGSLDHPHLLSKSIKFIQQLEQDQLGLETSHPHEPVTRASLQKLASDGSGLSLSFDEYSQLFTNYLNDPNQVLL